MTKYNKIIFLIVIVAVWLFIPTLIYNKIFATIQDETLLGMNSHNSSNEHFGIHVGQNPNSLINVGDLVYVANSDDNTVSVINATTNNKIKDIKVGNGPSQLRIYDKHMKNGKPENLVYVANYDNNTVSVINATTNNKIKDIKVGRNPPI